MTTKQIVECNIDYTRVVLAVLNGKGGVGKSLLAQLLIEYILMGGLVPWVVQVDKQARLAELNDFEVITIESDPAKLRHHPSEQLTRFAPITQKAEEGGKAGVPGVLDVGANEEGNLCYWAAQSEFADDLEEFGLRAVIFIIFTTDQEAIEKAGEAYALACRTVPGAQFVFVANERFGRFKELHPQSSAQKAYDKLIKPHLGLYPLLTMPKMPEGGYEAFEPHRLRFGDVINMPIADVMSLTGSLRANAKIWRSDVAWFVGTMFEQFARLQGSK